VAITMSGGSPLARVESFAKATCPTCGRPARRETDTMDTFVDSSWYFLRFTSPHESSRPLDAAKVQAWMPVLEQSLVQAGADLAKVLNTALAG
jgi:leucyl-tRNA synthetase